MKEKVLTNNISEKITIKWDGIRFILVREDKLRVRYSGYDIPIISVILNPAEMMELVKFAGSLGGD